MPAIKHIEPISDTKIYENNAKGKEKRAKICNIFGPISHFMQSQLIGEKQVDLFKENM